MQKFWKKRPNPPRLQSERESYKDCHVAWKQTEGVQLFMAVMELFISVVITADLMQKFVKTQRTLA